MSTFTAKYSGPCAGCPNRIEPGQEVVRDDEGLVHADCGPSIDQLGVAPDETVCPDCFMVHSGECL